LGVRILAVAIDFTSFQAGLLQAQQMTPAQAHAEVMGQRGHHYDPDVVDALTSLLGQLAQDQQSASARGVKTVTSKELEAGMVLSKDLLSPSGMLLLTAGHVLDDAVIGKISSFERSIGWQLTADVLPPAAPSQA
jgi:hypothetical protein